MGLATEIDRLLRHSIFARAQPYIRAKAPWLHWLLVTLRDILLPFRSRHGLSRYQHRAIERFYAFARGRGPLLEIGSDVEACVLRELSDREKRPVTGINIDVDFARHAQRSGDGCPRYEMIQGDARALPFRDGSVSRILSVTAFEHVHDLARALVEMDRILEPGGLVYSDFGPIWSCSIGHHVFAQVDGIEARHWKPGKNPVPHFGHLLMEPEELRRAVLEKSWVTPNLAEAIIRWIYRGDGVNRVFYEDYVKIFHASPFEVRHLVPVREHVPRSMQRILEERCPGYTDFSVRMVEVVLEKTGTRPPAAAPVLRAGAP